MTTNSESLNFGQFRVLLRDDGSPWILGRGAMGVTYLAINTSLDCQVALKVIDSSRMVSEEDEKRFTREARTMAALRHKNIATVFHLGKEDGQFFYAMEIIDGENLQEFVSRSGPMPVDAALRVTLQISQALIAADRQHMVHRDVKPANIMIVPDADEDAWPFVKLIDFGVVRPVSAPEGASYATMPGFVGTAQFASPEQIQEHAVDARADIYSLGCTLWYLLVGSPPFEGSLAHVFHQHLNVEPRWFELDHYPKAVVELLGGMLEKHPQRRLGPLEVKREVALLLTDVTLQAPPGAALDRAGLSPRWRTAVLARSRLLMILACTFVLFFMVLRAAWQETPRSERHLKQSPMAKAPTVWEIKDPAEAVPSPGWTYLAAGYPASNYLGSSRRISLARTAVPRLLPPGDTLGWSTVDRAAIRGEIPTFVMGNPFDAPIFLSEVSVFGGDLEVTLESASVRESVAEQKTPARSKGRAEESSPRQEIDRARRNIERTLRKLF